jgi:hypothetical protein
MFQLKINVIFRIRFEQWGKFGKTSLIVLSRGRVKFRSEDYMKKTTYCAGKIQLLRFCHIDNYIKRLSFQYFMSKTVREGVNLSCKIEKILKKQTKLTASRGKN